MDLPEHIDVEVSHLKLGESLHVKDVVVENAEILNDSDVVVVGISIPRAAREEKAEEVEIEGAEPIEEESEDETES